MSFKDDLKLILKDDFEQIWQSFFEPKYCGFFVNLIKTNAKFVKSELENLNIKFDEILPNFFITEPQNKAILSKSNLFNDAQIYIQNPSSYLAALNLGAKNKMNVLDMCGSPGGKSIAIAGFMGNKADLRVMEINKDRFYTLKSNLIKFDCQFIRTFNKDARSIAYTCKDTFDRILLDAPCSGYAGFDENFKEKSQKEIKSLSKLQKSLLNAALNALKSGGEMIYSTCTFYEQENEEVVQNALNSKFKIEILPIDLFGSKAKFQTNKFGTRILPDDKFDGFFISKIKKLA